MEVRCERCKAQYDVDDAGIPPAGLALQCNQCSHVFLVKKKELVVTVPVKPGTLAGIPLPASSAGRRTAQVPAASDPASEWRVKLLTGEIFPCRDLQTLQKWVVERRIGRDDEVAPPGQSYKKLAELPELDTFFEVVDAADRGAPPAAPAQPARPPPPRKTVTRVTAVATPAVSPSSFDVDLGHGHGGDELDASERAAVGGGHGLRNGLLVVGALAVIVGGAWVLEPGLFAPITALLSKPAPPPQAAPPAPAPEPVNPAPPAPAPEPPKAPEPAPAAAEAAPPAPEPTPAPAAPAPEKAGPKGPKALLAQAERLRQKGEVEKAMDLYDRVAEADPENADALAGRGLCYLDLEQNEAAVRAFRETLRVDPEHADALLGAAEAARSLGRAAEAIQHYKKYLEFHPDGEEAAVARNALQELGR